MILKNRDTIVFAGDSVTDADKLLTTDKLGNGYVKLVHDALIAFHPEYEFRVINAGVNGNTSRQLLARWQEDVLAQKPDVLFLMIGINDVWRHFDYQHPSARFVSKEEYRTNLLSLCKQISGVREFYLLPPYYMERNRSDEMFCMTQEYAHCAAEVASQCGTKVLNVQSAFDEYMLHRSGQSISWDRVHPGPIGSLILARVIMEELCK